MAIRFPTWTGRAALAVVGLFILLVAVSSWLHANAIRAELMVPLAASTDFDLVVESNEAGRATVNRTPASDKEGIWGLEGQRAYAQLSTIVRVTEAVFRDRFDQPPWSLTFLKQQRDGDYWRRGTRLE